MKQEHAVTRVKYSQGEKVFFPAVVSRAFTFRLKFRSEYRWWIFSEIYTHTQPRVYISRVCSLYEIGELSACLYLRIHGGGTYTGFLRNPPAGVHHENKRKNRGKWRKRIRNGVFCMTSSRVCPPHGSRQQGKYFAADTPMKNSRNRDDNGKIVSIFSPFSL